MAIGHGRNNPPPSFQLKVFGGGSGLLAFAFSPQSKRLHCGEPGDTEPPAAASIEVDAPAIVKAATDAADATWLALFPR